MHVQRIVCGWRRTAVAAAVLGCAAASPILAQDAAPPRADLALGIEFERSALLPPLRLVEDPASAAGEEPAGTAPEPKKPSTRGRYVLPVVLSALVPGTGEIAAGHPWRGLPFLLVDVATWVGYAHYRTEGKDWRERYEAFADAHWVYQRFDDRNGNGDRDPGEMWGWQESLERYYGPTQTDPALRWWDPTLPPHYCTCPYIPREEDPQHYYENIGKYRYYWSGWDDWLYNPDDPANSDSQGHRREYGLMRIESNDNFDRATNLVVVAMATRLLSVVQSVFLVRGNIAAEQRLSLRPAMLPGRAAGVAFRYEY